MPIEVRKVPPYWEHPLDDSGRMEPMPIDKTFEQAAADWKKEFLEWENNAFERSKYEPGTQFWEFEPPPEREHCRPWTDEQATWLQVWHSDGTPITPAYPSSEELIEYLTTTRMPYAHGNWTRESAERFVKKGFTMPMITRQGIAPSHNDE